uniref:4a-hydroxytetrahydrobiopterin dehydratase n=1 Tax=Haptolina brevifila TaxID=156173 RepID=A0A7S2H5S5_9EUKA
MEHGLYEKAGLAVTILPDCEPGKEPQHVLVAQAEHPQALCVGTIEQNVLVPYTAENGADKLVAVGAMFGRSPLCLAALPTAGGQGIGGAGQKPITVGAHEDTVALLQRLLPDATVLDVPREAKLGMLKDGRLDAVQIYDCTESVTLRQEQCAGDGPLRVIPFEELGTKEATLGYAQVLFTTSKALAEEARREGMHRFMSATFEGWRLAIGSPEEAAAAVLKRQPTDIDHFGSAEEAVAASIRESCAYVKRTSAGDGMLGVIDPALWAEANQWLLNMEGVGAQEEGRERVPRLDPTLWAPNKKLMLGTGLAHELLQASKALAAEAVVKLGRSPKLCIISVGKTPLGENHPDARRRLELFGVPGASWFDRVASGAAVGVDVEEMVLPEATSTAELVGVLRGVCERVDGLQLMWPLPTHIDAVAAYEQIPRAIDADGATWRATMELGGGQRAVTSGQLELLKNAPVTASAVIRLLDYYDEPIAGKRVLVVGRSKLCGSPLVFMFGARGALVTSAHSQTPPEQLAAACLEADILVPCVGSPGMIRGEWMKPGSVIVNVGTTFEGDKLLPDIPSAMGEMQHVRRVASCPNGIGPLSSPVLLYQTALNAARRTPKPTGADEATPKLKGSEVQAWVASNAPWELCPRGLLAPSAESAAPIPVLARTYHFATYPLAVAFVTSVSAAAEAVNHHPNLSIVHSCTDGVDVAVELFTYAVNGLTGFDTAAAGDIEKLYRGEDAAGGKLAPCELKPI